MVPFVGRDESIEILNKHLKAIQQEAKGHVVFITGEPGIGKSELANQFLEQVRIKYPETSIGIGKGATIGGKTERGDPYQPFREALSSFINSEKSEIKGKKILELIKEVGPDWIGLLPLIGPLAGTIWKTVQTVSSLQLQSIDIPMVQQYLQILREMSEKKPVVLFIDDLQWADDSSFDLLFCLSQRIQDCRILVLSAYRPADIAIGRQGQKHPLKEILPEMHRYKLCHEIALGFLKEEEVDNYLSTEFSPNDFPEGLSGFVFEYTEGNPLFMTEMIKLLCDRGLILNDQGRWRLVGEIAEIEFPRSVEETLTKRLELLEEDLRMVIERASVQGEEFTVSILSCVLGWKGSKWKDELTLLDKLEVLERTHRLIMEKGDISHLNAGLPDYRFVHTLFHKLLYDGLSGRKKILLHQRIGECLERRYEDRNIEEIAPDLAIHFTEGRIYAKARDYSLIAAKRCREVYATNDAIRYCLNGLKVIGHLPPTDKNAALRSDLLLEMGKAEEFLGNTDSAVNHYRDAEEILKAIEDEERAGKVYYSMGSILYKRNDWEKAIEYLNQSLEIRNELKDAKGMINVLRKLRPLYWKRGDLEKLLSKCQESLEICDMMGDQASKAKIMVNILGWVAEKQGRLDDAQSIYEESLTLRKPDDPRGKALSLRRIGRIWRRKRNFIKALENYEKSIKICEEAGYLLGKACGLEGIGNACRNEGNLEEAIRKHEESLEIKKKLKNMAGVASSLNTIGRIYFSLGHWEKALEKYEESLKLKEESGLFLSTEVELNNIGSIYKWQGRWDEALRLFEKRLKKSQARNDISATALTLNHIGSIYRWKGDPKKALTVHQESLKLTERLRLVSRKAITLGYIGKAHIDLRNYEEALRAFEESLKIRRKIGNLAGQAVNLGNIGEVYYHQGMLDNAMTMLQESLKLREMLGKRLGVAIADLNIGKVYLARKDHEKARSYVEEAVKIFEQLKSWQLEEAREVLRRCYS
ncbi:MAG: tetratricopeptide repeat protein [Candidatus Latescibacteria bacterium]|nr:tetratricopeptide repeat protein [Candidatus Latescibacterota bacterium]